MSFAEALDHLVQEYIDTTKCPMPFLDVKYCLLNASLNNLKEQHPEIFDEENE